MQPFFYSSFGNRGKRKIGFFHFIAKNFHKKKIPRNTMHLILEKSEGNPFFIEQTIYYLQERNIINEKLEVTQKEIEIPADINSLIVSRIDKLKPELKRVTKIASVLGKKFTNKVLSLMINESEIDKYILNGVEENLWYSLSQMDNMFKKRFYT